MLKTMYPPQANSPLTTLAGALTQSATEIMVLAGVVLPDAPNLLVIGGETEQAETVLMTAKNGNALTLVRAVQGVAREWPAGSTIARFFTAKDLADIQDNIRDIASYRYDYTLTVSAWTGTAGSYSQTTTLPGVTADNTLRWGGVTAADQRAISQCRVDLTTAADGALSWSAAALPAADIAVYVIDSGVPVVAA